MKKIVTCICMIILLILLLQNNSFATQTTYMDMNGEEWHNYLKGVYNRLESSNDKILTYDEWYMVNRAKSDLEEKGYYTGNKLMNYSSRLKQMDEEGGQYTDEYGMQHQRYTIEYFYKLIKDETNIDPPKQQELLGNVSGSTDIQKFNSVDKRYWASVLISEHQNQLTGKKDRNTTDLDIIWRVKKMKDAGGFKFPSISKEEAAIYTQYYTKGICETVDERNVFTFTSFETYIDLLNYFKDKETNPGGSTNPGDGSTNPGDGSTNPGDENVGGETVNEVNLGDIISGADEFLNSANHDPIKIGNLQKMSDNVYNILFFVGIFAAVIVGVILGIKFMLEGAEGKAEVKTMLVPYVIGCVVLFGAFAIWKIVLTILQA